MATTLSAICLMALAITGIVVWLNTRLQRQIHNLQQRVADHSQFEDELSAMRCELAHLHSRCESWEETRREQSEWAAETESLNLNRKGQVLRLHRRGESATDIARSLELGAGEVALIIKVFEMGRRADNGGERNSH